MRFGVRPGALLVVAAIALAGCTQDGKPTVAGMQPRGATVAFESIDGPPQDHFNTLVRNLNDEAQQRRLAVLSREGSSAYRVRGYLAAKVTKDRTTITWVWDVFDSNEQRAIRLNGEEVAKRAGNVNDAWNAADEAMLRRIASNSMEQLQAFLTSGDAVPVASAPSIIPAVALMADNDSSPEAAGIFRTFQANADPAPSRLAAGDVPLPPRRPDDQATSVQASL